ncbi:MAG: hypothetical protein AAFV26_06925 [Pseudomonadota bacterium]
MLVALTYAVAIARVDMGELLQAAARPRAVLMIGVCILALMIALPAALFYAANALSLSDEAARALVYTSIAPPIASAAAVCFLLGADAGLALRLSVIAAFASPLIGPWLAATLFGEALSVDPVVLSLRLAAMIGAGAVLGMLLRRILTPRRIAADPAAFDGLAAIVMIVFAIPLFDGIGPMIAGDPMGALGVFGLVMAANSGLQVVSLIVLARLMRPETAVAIALSVGSRNGGLYLASLPASPYFSLFVALYQVPIYLTAVLMRLAANRFAPGLR